MGLESQGGLSKQVISTDINARTGATDSADLVMISLQTRLSCFPVCLGRDLTLINLASPKAQIACAKLVARFWHHAAAGPGSKTLHISSVV